MAEPTMLGYAKKGKWVEPFVTAIGGRMASMEEIYANTSLPMAFSGISKSAARTQAQLHGLDWWYVDTGYVGNWQDKIWFRITKNCHQNIESIRERSSDRLQKLKIDRTLYKRGQKILVVPPDPKVCSCYGLVSPEQWIADTTALIGQYTDRVIEIRHRPASRQVRVNSDTFVNALQQDVNCVVVWTSNCGVESVIHGIPVISLGPSAALQVSGSLANIDALPNVNQDQVEAWLRHLSYCQFSLAEMRSGRAWELLHS